MIIFNYPYMGSMLVPLLGGLLWKGATRKGAFAAAIAGGIVGVVSFFIGIPGPLYGIINVDLTLNLDYGYSVPKTCQKVQEKVKSAIENMTGLTVENINIQIANVMMESGK